MTTPNNHAKMAAECHERIYTYSGLAFHAPPGAREYRLHDADGYLIAAGHIVVESDDHHGWPVSMVRQDRPQPKDFFGHEELPAAASTVSYHGHENQSCVMDIPSMASRMDAIRTSVVPIRAWYDRGRYVVSDRAAVSVLLDLGMAELDQHGAALHRELATGLETLEGYQQSVYWFTVRDAERLVHEEQP